MEKTPEKDNTKYLLLNNEPIEEKLHVIAVVSNPCNYKITYKLANEFTSRMEKEPNVILYLVELVYGDQEFKITYADNKNHLQLRGEIPLWHKENMINLGIKYLLPNDWKAVAWIDTDIEFESTHWALDTLKLLNNGKDFVQLFTRCIDMTFDEQIMNNFTGFAYQYCKNFKKGVGINYWHPGFAWACNRKTYDKMGGIYQEGIVGFGDKVMCNTFTKNAAESLKQGMSQQYIDFVKNLQNKMNGIKLGYIDGTIKHYFHGKKENKNYYEREDILIKYQYDPYSHIELNDQGLIIPSQACPKDFLRDIMDYFKSRNEDEIMLAETIPNQNDKDVLAYKINFILKEFEKIQKSNKCSNEVLLEFSKKDLIDTSNNVKPVTNYVNTKPVTNYVNTKPVTNYVNTKPVSTNYVNTKPVSTNYVNTKPFINYVDVNHNNMNYNGNKSRFSLHNKLFDSKIFNVNPNNAYPNNININNINVNNNNVNNKMLGSNQYNKGFLSFKSLNFK